LESHREGAVDYKREGKTAVRERMDGSKQIWKGNIGSLSLIDQKRKRRLGGRRAVNKKKRTK